MTENRVTAQMTRDQIIAEGKRRQKHAAGCKADLAKCPTCATNVEWFASVPAHILNTILSN